MNTNDKSALNTTGQILDFSKAKERRSAKDELGRQRDTPLYVDYKNGKITGSPHGNGSSHPKGTQTADFGDRMTRIRSSLDKINRLMSEIKRMSTDERQTRQPTIHS